MQGGGYASRMETLEVRNGVVLLLGGYDVVVGVRACRVALGKNCKRAVSQYS